MTPILNPTATGPTPAGENEREREPAVSAESGRDPRVRTLIVRFLTLKLSEKLTITDWLGLNWQGDEKTPDLLRFKEVYLRAIRAGRREDLRSAVEAMERNEPFVLHVSGVSDEKGEG